MDQLKEGQRQRAGSGRRCRAGRRGSKGVKEMGASRLRPWRGWGRGLLRQQVRFLPGLPPPRGWKPGVG